MTEIIHALSHPQIDFLRYFPQFAPMKSMTGFGKASIVNQNFSISVMVKTVNSRFLDIRLSLSPLYAQLEMDFRKKLKAQVSRGSVEVSIYRKFFPQSSRLPWDEKKAQNWLKNFWRLSQKMGLEESRDSRLLLSVPGLFDSPVDFQKIEALNIREKKQILKLFYEALEDCVQTHEKEGRALKKNLFNNLTRLQRLVYQMEQAKKQVARSLKSRYKKRWSSGLSSVPVTSERLAQEVALHLGKMDINEEISRLQVHLKNMASLMEKDEPMGKKLDFYSQELLRELNTVGSKSGGARLTQLVIQAKSLVESYREQVQNVQ